MKENQQLLSAYFDDILNSCSDGITIVCQDGTVIYCNDQYERLSGVTRENFVGKNMMEFVKSGLFSESSTLKVVQTKQPVSILQKISTGREHLVTGVPILNDQDEVVFVVNTNRDVTELSLLRRRLEEQTQLTNQYLNEIKGLRQFSAGTSGVIAQSPAFQRVIEIAKNIAQFDSSVLILGESGVGKEVVAQLIHRTSPRAGKPFIRINCGAIPKELAESELFGYDPGAFTGAKKQGKAGVFELADKGTLFLDEIGELSLDLQVKLLRVLQDFEITRVGGTTQIKTDVRLISATNRNLEQMVKEGRFREDLYYRLNIVPLEIPPLKERREDIIPLINFFLKNCEQKYKTEKFFSPRALLQLDSYDWPGNVRELENLVERMYIISKFQEIDLSDLPLNFFQDSPMGEELESALTDEQAASSFTLDVSLPLDGMGLKEATEMFEQIYLQRALKGYRNLRDAAKDLGVDASTLSRKMKKYHLMRTIDIKN